MSRLAVQTGQAVTRQFAPASRAIVIRLVDHPDNDPRFADRQAPPAAIGLERPGTDLRAKGRKDLVEENRIFRIIEPADLRRPQQQAAIIGDGFQPLEVLRHLFFQGIQTDGVDDDVDRIPDGHAPLV